MTPRRVQLRRVKGWRMPPNTVKVDRTTKWGNPFKPSQKTLQCARTAVADYERWLTGPSDGTAHKAAGRIIGIAARTELRGKNLACWCKPGWPCHAAVLLRIANR